jgi:hypothetical protein
MIDVDGSSYQYRLNIISNSNTVLDSGDQLCFPGSVRFASIAGDRSQEQFHLFPAIFNVVQIVVLMTTSTYTILSYLMWYVFYNYRSVT